MIYHGDNLFPMALSLDNIILVGEILKYRYTTCIPSCLDNEDVFMIACI